MADQVIPRKPEARHRFWREFEDGFRTRAAGAVRQCCCGRVFYNPGNGWDWDEGELDSLAANPNATSVEWACGEVRIDGVIYAQDCTCWHERGLTILKWVLGHDEEIAQFLTNVKAAKTAEANRAPVVG
jgi:hypothetical protein